MHACFFALFKWLVLRRVEQVCASTPVSVYHHVALWGKQGQMDHKQPHPLTHTHTPTCTRTTWTIWCLTQMLLRIKSSCSSTSPLRIGQSWCILTSCIKHNQQPSTLKTHWLPHGPKHKNPFMLTSIKGLWICSTTPDLKQALHFKKLPFNVLNKNAAAWWIS